MEGCLGCKASGSGLGRRSHNKECRRRFAEQINSGKPGNSPVDAGLSSNDNDEGASSEDSEEAGESVVPSGSRNPLPDSGNEESSGESECESSNQAFEGSIGNVCNAFTEPGCTPAQATEILMKFDEELKIGRHTNKEIEPRAKSKIDVVEVYSPPRVSLDAQKHEFRAGWSLDLNTVDDNGEAWNFDILEMGERAEQMVSFDKPELLVVSPVCGAFSQLQGFNYGKMNPRDVENKLRSAMIHLKFAMVFCNLQALGGRTFMFEHPANATSWQVSMVKELLKLENVVAIEFDFCFFGMKVPGHDGLAKNRTRIMTNSKCVAKRFARAQCQNDHQHVSLTGFKAHRCQICLDKFCREARLAIKEELAPRSIHNGEPFQKMILAMQEEIAKHPHDDIDDFFHLYQGQEFDDDTAGRPFENDRAVRVRKIEIDFVKRMNVYIKVAREEATMFGATVITIRWGYRLP